MSMLILAPPSYGSSPIKRERRTSADIDDIKGAIHRALEADHPMTVRQVFYRLVSEGVIAKTEQEYKTTVCRLLGVMRREKQIPYGWITDSTRWMRKPTTHSSVEDAIESTVKTYRRALWNDQSAYVEVWLEKDALAGVLFEVTNPWDVPLMVTRGYPSLTYLYEAAEAISHVGCPAYLYYLGDHDPTGVDIPRKVEQDLREFAPHADITFERIAVTQEQVQRWNLPLRPTKGSDSRGKDWDGGSVEVDAIPPTALKALVDVHITQHIDQGCLERTKLIEAAERKSADAFITGLHFWRS